MSNRKPWADETDYKPRYSLLSAGFGAYGQLLRDTSRRFHDLMDAAMLVSGYKYGAVADAYPERIKAVAITGKESTAKDASLERRLQLYRETGNVEYLVDVANFAMIEFMHTRHPKANYTPTDSSGSPGRVVDESAGGGMNQMSNKDLNIIAKG